MARSGRTSSRLRLRRKTSLSRLQFAFRALQKLLTRKVTPSSGRRKALLSFVRTLSMVSPSSSTQIHRHLQSQNPFQFHYHGPQCRGIVCRLLLCCSEMTGLSMQCSSHSSLASPSTFRYVLRFPRRSSCLVDQSLTNLRLKPYVLRIALPSPLFKVRLALARRSLSRIWVITLPSKARLFWFRTPTCQRIISP